MANPHSLVKPLEASFRTTVPHEKRNEFIDIVRTAEGKLRTQFFSPKIDVREGDSPRPANTLEDMKAEIKVSVGPLRDAIHADERHGFFNRALSAFEYELSHHGFEISRIQPKVLGR